MISLRGLTVTYRDTGHRAVENLSLEVARGERLALLGPSGCGKTTTLLALLGLLTEEEARVEGRVETGGARLSAVFQRPALLPWLSARANVAFPLAAAGRAAEDRGGAVTGPLLEMAGLSAFADRLPHQLSAGMQQRLSLLRALAAGPDLVVLDEPFSSLDPASKRPLLEDVARMLSARRVAALFVTHDVAEAVTLGDRIVVLTDCPAREKRRYELRVRAPGDNAPLLRALLSDYER